MENVEIFKVVKDGLVKEMRIDVDGN